MCVSLLEFKRAAVGRRQLWMNVAVSSFDKAANINAAGFLFSNAATLDRCVFYHPRAVMSCLLGGFLQHFYNLGCLLTAAI